MLANSERRKSQVVLALQQLNLNERKGESAASVSAECPVLEELDAWTGEASTRPQRGPIIGQPCIRSGGTGIIVLMWSPDGVEEVHGLPKETLSQKEKGGDD